MFALLKQQCLFRAKYTFNPLHFVMKTFFKRRLFTRATMRTQSSEARLDSLKSPRRGWRPSGDNAEGSRAD